MKLESKGIKDPRVGILKKIADTLDVKMDGIL